MPMISLPDLKAHLNLTTDADDDLLTGKIAVAEEWVGQYTGTATDAENIPAPLKEAVRLLASHLFENREASLVGVTAQALPFGVMDLITPYREWAF